MSTRERYSSLLRQFNSLIRKQLPSASAYGVLTEALVPLWINNHLREQLELLHLLILVTSEITVTLADIDQLVELMQVCRANLPDLESLKIECK